MRGFNQLVLLMVLSLAAGCGSGGDSSDSGPGPQASCNPACRSGEVCIDVDLGTPCGAVQQPSRACQCELPDEPGPTACDALVSRTWNGSEPCLPLTQQARTVLSRAFSLWRTPLNTVCRYDGFFGGTGPCGALVPSNAIYCGLDNSIAYDVNFLSNQTSQFGDFAPVAILSHEWGHRNQQWLGLLGAGFAIQRELQADCQAGIFAAVEESLGRLDVGDVCEAFASLCQAGDPFGTPWFAPNAHGTCLQRTQAFEMGYFGARNNLEEVCGGDPLEAMLFICPFG